MSECGKDLACLVQDLKGVGQRRQSVVERHQMAAPLTPMRAPSPASGLASDTAILHHVILQTDAFLTLPQHRCHLRTLCD